MIHAWVANAIIGGGSKVLTGDVVTSAASPSNA
jgi:hypothetical protein